MQGKGNERDLGLIFFFFWLATQGNIFVLIIIKMILNGIFNKFYQFYIYLNGFQLYYKSYSIFEWTLDTSAYCFIVS